MISSVSNPQVKNIIELQKKSKERMKQKCFVVEGIKMVEEAKNHCMKKAYIAEDYYEELQNSKPEFLQGLDYEIVTKKVFKHMSDTVTPQGILAVVQMPEYDLETMTAKQDGLFMLLENLRDPGNLGTIIRTSEGAGVTAVILSKDSVDVYNPKVIRSTMGSIYRVPVIYVEDYLDTAKRLQEAGITLYAAHLKGINTYDVEDYCKGTGFMIGNEAKGLSDEASSVADILIKIPMLGKVESLNAAVASAILMYEAARQRRHPM